MKNPKELEQFYKYWETTKDLIDQCIDIMLNLRQSGHPGGSLGCTEFFVALYFDIMKHNKNFQMDGNGEDLFFLSNGHISPVWYSVLARSGYFPVSELTSFRTITSLNTPRNSGAGDGTYTAGIVSFGLPSTGKTETWNGSAWTEVNDGNTAKIGIDATIPWGYDKSGFMSVQ